MKLFSIIKNTLRSACVYFTAAEFLILVAAETLSLTASASGSPVRMFLSLKSTVLVFAACLFMSLLNLIWRLDLSLTLRTLFHFMGSLAVWSVIFIVIPKAYTDTAQIIVRCGVFAVIYAVVGLIALIVHSVKVRRATEKTDYEPSFGDRPKAQ